MILQHPNSHHGDEYSGGPYGQDGAPASNFMSFPTPAHRLPTPQRPNVAPSERPLPPLDRFSPNSSHDPQTPPAYSNENPFPPPLECKLSPPRAAFLEPASPTSHSFDSHSSHGLTYGQSEKPLKLEHSHADSLQWKDLERAKAQGSSNWLQKQSRAGSKFKTATWILAILALAILGILIAKIVTTKSPAITSPASLTWANGANQVPTFGRNTTATATGSTQTSPTAPQGPPLTTRQASPSHFDSN